MIEERRTVEKDCQELEQAVRKAFLLTLEAFHREQKKREAALWQAAWINWDGSLEDSEPQTGKLYARP